MTESESADFHSLVEGENGVKGFPFIHPAIAKTTATDMRNIIGAVIKQVSEENVLNNLAIQIDSKYELVQKYYQRPLGQDHIVCSVDPLLRQVNPAAYRPIFVIIGPLRNYDQILEHIEIQKRVYLASFLQRAETKASLKDFFKLIKDRADEIYDCYEEAHERSWDFVSLNIKQDAKASGGTSQLFMEMILVDAGFIIELFLKAYYKKGRHDFQRDLFLAQNQLPMFILKDLYELAFAANPDYPSFLQLTCHFFSPYYNQNISIDDVINSHSDYKAKLETAKHFTDLLRTLQLPYPSRNNSANQKSFWSKWIRNKTKNTEESLESGRVQGKYLYSAVLLREAGIRFKMSSSRCLLDIEFNHRNGKLSIPPLRVDESTESFFRNLIAWEQRYYPQETYISDYVYLMEYLIKSTEDVDLLVRKRIIVNQLGSNIAVVTLFNSFIKHVTQVEKNSYSDTFKKLNRYHLARRHSWWAILRIQYFSTLWRGVATVAAIVLLLLTATQTICALISL